MSRRKLTCVSFAIPIRAISSNCNKKKRRVRQGISANVRIFLDQKNSDLLSYKFTSVTVLRCKKFIIVTIEISIKTSSTHLKKILKWKLVVL
jgi:hypothetical protein